MQTREKLRDKGYYRWPPHINLLYPFVEPLNYDLYVPHISEAIASIEPFQIKLSEFCVFGGRKRGTLWLDPVVENSCDQLITLQQKLELAVPVCTDQRLKGAGGFRPHLTLTHLPSKDEADATAYELQKEWSVMSFNVSEIFILERNGHHDQFRIMWRIPFSGLDPIQEGPHGKFIEGMPMEQDNWVRAAMDEYSSRYMGKSRREKNIVDGSTEDVIRKEKISRCDRGRRKTMDNPEQIQLKRAQRAAKKAALMSSVSQNFGDEVTAPGNMIANNCKLEGIAKADSY